MSFLEMTVSGGVLITLTALVRVFFVDRLPKTMFTALWSLAALRLVLPFSAPILPRAALPAAQNLPKETAVLLADVVEVSASGGFPTENLLLALWAAGAVFLAGRFLLCWVHNSLLFRQSLPAEDGAVNAWLSEHVRLRRRVQVRVSDRITSPLTYGVLRPVILLPKRLLLSGEKDALPFVLTHEFMHIRRFDALRKPLFAAVLCLHWFNPATWLLYVLANRDMELSCDAGVLQALGLNSKAEYALALLRMEELRGRGFSLASHFSKNSTEERMNQIMKYKKPTIFALALAALLVVSGTAVFATTAKDAAELPAPDSVAVENETSSQPETDAESMEAEEVPVEVVDPDGNEWIVEDTRIVEIPEGAEGSYAVRYEAQDGSEVETHVYTIEREGDKYYRYEDGKLVDEFEGDPSQLEIMTGEAFDWDDPEVEYKSYTVELLPEAEYTGDMEYRVQAQPTPAPAEN